MVKRAFGFVFFYGAWIAAFKLFILTIITYILMSSSSKLEDISEFVAANEIPVMSLSCVGFVAVVLLLNPITNTTLKQVFQPDRFREGFFSSLFRGWVLGLSVTGAFILSGHYDILGGFLQVENTVFVAISFFFRILFLVALIYLEEFIFRWKILHQVRETFGSTYGVIISSVLYCGLKLLQFSLSWWELGTLFLASLLLAAYALRENTFVKGAGILMGLLITFHVGFGLPIFGNGFSGAVLTQYRGSFEVNSQKKKRNDPTTASDVPLGERGESDERNGHESEPAWKIEANQFEKRMDELLTGGQRGPLGGVVLQLLLLLEMARQFFGYLGQRRRKTKKTLLPRAISR